MKTRFLIATLILALQFTTQAQVAEIQPIVCKKIVAMGEKVWLLKNQSLFLSMDEGITNTDVLLNKRIRDIHGLPDGTLYITTRDGKLLYTKDDAATFEVLAPPKAKYRMVTASPDGRNLLLATSDKLTISSDAGMTWQSVELPAPDVKQILPGFEEGQFFLLTSSGVWKSFDAGFNWHPLNDFPDSITALTLSLKDRRFYAIQRNQVHSASEGTSAWELIDFELPEDASSIQFDDYSRNLYVTTATGIVKKKLEQQEVKPASIIKTSCIATNLSSPRLINGRLDSILDCSSNGRAFDYFLFDGQQGKLVSVRVQSSAFPSVLRLYLNSLLIAQATNGDVGGRPWLNVRLPDRGSCRLEIATQTGQTGNYSFWFEHPTPATAIQPGSLVSSALTTTSYASVEFGVGFGAVRYIASYEAGRLIDALVTTATCDTTLVVFGPDGRRITLDHDTGIGWHPWISTRATTTGIYTIEVTTRYPLQTGTFSLRLFRPGSAENLTVGTSVVRDLNDASSASVAQGAGYFANRYVFSINAGETIEFRARSQDINLMLYLFGANTTIVSSASAPSPGTYAVLRYRSPTSMLVTLEVTSTDIGDQGTFFLTSSRAAH